MTEVLSFLWFSLRVFGALTTMLLLSSFIRLKKYKALLFLSLLVGNLLLLVWLNTLGQQKSFVLAKLTPSTPPPYSNQVGSLQISKSEAYAKINQLKKTLEAQPTHVDTLINLGLVYDSLDNHQEAKNYWERAYKIDPYHQFFLAFPKDE